jgi:gliding motility-associated-like protein
MNFVRKAYFLLFFSILFLQNFSLPSFGGCDTANAGINQVVCADTAYLNGNTPTSSNGSWSLFSGTGTILNPTSPSAMVIGLGLGQNVFVWSITGGGCPASSDTVVLTVNSIPTIANAGPDQFLCNDSVSTLSANTPVVGTGEWVLISGSGIIQNPFSPSTTVSSLGYGINVFRWKIESGTCASINDVSISRYQPTINSVAGPDKIVCDTTFFLSANIPAHGQGIWTVVSGSANIFYDNIAGTQVDSTNFGDTLNFVWTISSGVCPASSDTQRVIILIPPNPLAGNDQVLCSPLSVLNASLDAGTGTWSVLSGNAIISNPNAASTAINSIGPGQNQFVWTGTNGVCPIDKDTISVFNYENSVPDAGQDQQLCSLSSVFAADAPVIGTGAWTLISGAGSVLFPNSPTSIVSNLSLGQNVFSWTISNGTCPSKTDTVVLIVYAPSTTAYAGQDFAVCGSSATLSGTIPVNGIGTWSVLSGTGTFTSVNAASTFVNGLSPGQNSLTWTIINGACPASSDTIVITSVVAPSGAFISADTSICNDSLLLFAAGPQFGSGSWSVLTPGPALSSSSDTLVMASNLVVGQNVFVWTVSGGICPSVDDSVVVVRDEVPSSAAAGADITSSSGTVQLSANTPVIGTGSWLNYSAQGNVVTPQSPNSLFITNQSADIDLIWSIANGVCPASFDTLHLKIELIPVPEIITPNGDGQNDYFLVRATQFSGSVGLQLYNRWGGLVYRNENYKNDFEGKNNSGAELPDDTYFYEIQENGVVMFKGFLTIKRK